MEEDDVHIPDHEDGLDGDGGEEVDGGLVEEEIVADAWDQCKMLIIMNTMIIMIIKRK